MIVAETISDYSHEPLIIIRPFWHLDQNMLWYIRSHANTLQLLKRAKHSEETAHLKISESYLHTFNFNCLHTLELFFSKTKTIRCRLR